MKLDQKTLMIIDRISAALDYEIAAREGRLPSPVTFTTRAVEPPGPSWIGCERSRLIFRR